MSQVCHFAIDKFKQHEIPLFICYSTEKSDIGTVVGLENFFKSPIVAWLITFSNISKSFLTSYPRNCPFMQNYPKNFKTLNLTV